jgi:hypothetical protein
MLHSTQWMDSLVLRRSRPLAFPFCPVPISTRIVLAGRAPGYWPDGSVLDPTGLPRTRDSAGS